jgi:hypothetical protein
MPPFIEPAENLGGLDFELLSIELLSLTPSALHATFVVRLLDAATPGGSLWHLEIEEARPCHSLIFAVDPVAESSKHSCALQTYRGAHRAKA